MGDLGGGSAPNLSGRRLEERAIRERWPMSDAVRIKILKRLTRIVDEDAVHEVGTPGHREVIAAARALLAADKLNLDQARLDLVARPPDAVEARDAWRQIADEAAADG